MIFPSRSAFDVVEFKDKSAALIMSTLQSDINNCLQRTQRSMQTHTAHVTAREKEMEDTKVTKSYTDLNVVQYNSCKYMTFCVKYCEIRNKLYKKNLSLFICLWISVSTLLVTILPLRCREKSCVQLKLQAMVNLV